MATSSIFANFVIRGEEAAKQFANAMEECEKTPEWAPKTKMPPLLTDHEAIRALVARGK